jgi:hypothetical protein
MIPVICIVRDELGFEHGRTQDLGFARLLADELGVGATVEIRCVIYRVTPQSMSEPLHDFFNE